MKWINKRIEFLAMQLTWKRLLAATGLFGLLYMLFVPESRDPALIIVFFTMLGIGPLATADQRSEDGKDTGERRRLDDE
jgi:hypothetical protein